MPATLLFGLGLLGKALARLVTFTGRTPSAVKQVSVLAVAVAALTTVLPCAAASSASTFKPPSGAFHLTLENGRGHASFAAANGRSDAYVSRSAPLHDPLMPSLTSLPRFVFRRLPTALPTA